MSDTIHAHTCTHEHTCTLAASAFVIRSEMRRPTMFKSVLEDAIELVVESAVDTGNAASVRIDEKRQAFALSTSADKLAGKNGQGSSVTCTGFIDSGVFEAGSAITGDVELALRSPPTEQNHTQGSESAARVSGNEPARAGDEASTNSGASGTQSAPYEEKTVSLKMAISVVETIVNSSGGSSGGGSKTGGGTKSEDTHLACEVIIADRVLLTTGDATSSTRLPLHVLLPRLHTCPSFALDNLCSVAFSVQLTLIEHASQAAAGDMSKTNSDKVRYKRVVCICAPASMTVCVCVLFVFLIAIYLYIYIYIGFNCTHWILLTESILCVYVCVCVCVLYCPSC